MRQYLMTMFRITLFATMLAMTAFFVPSVSAQTYPYNSTQETHACPTSGPGVTCIGGQLYRSTDASCQNDPRPGANATQLFACASVSFVCNTSSYPCAGCSAATSTVGATCTSPTGGRFTNQCGACSCPSGTQICSASNTCVAVIACPTGTTFDPCTNSCSTPYILNNQVTPQNGTINLTGDLTSTAGNVRLAGTSANQGDLFMVNGKAIRVDGAAPMSLNIGNYGGGSFQMNVAGLVTSQSLRLTTGAAAGRVLTSDATGNATWQTVDVGASVPGAAGQTLWHDGSTWVANSRMSVGGGAITIGPGSSPTLQIYDGNLQVDGALTAGSTTGLFQWRGAMRSTGENAGTPALQLFRTGGITASDLIQTYVGNLGSNPALFVKGSGRAGLGTDNPGFRLDVRDDAGAGGTAMIRINQDNVTRLWTGLRLDRQTNERWFLGMDATAGDSLLFRRNSTTNDLVIDGTTGKVTVASLQVTGGASAGQVLTSDASGNATWQAPAAGGACAATRQFVGVTAATYDGNRGGYKAADALCGAFDSGSTVCTAEEILNSYKCSTGSDAIASATGSAWINQGPPGFTAYSNDCDGWTSNAAGYYGRLWTFEWTTGGKATVRECNISPLQFACCK